MAISFLQFHDSVGSATSLSVTFTNPIAAGSIIAVAAYIDVATTTITVHNDKSDANTDSGKGIIVDNFPGNFFTISSFVQAFLTPTVGAQTITVTSDVAVYGIGIWEIAGLTGAIFDKVVTAPGTATAADSGSTGTLSSANEAAIGFGLCQNTFTASGTGWTLNDIDANGALLEQRVLSSTAAINGTGTQNGSNFRMWCVTFMSGAGSLPAGTTFNTSLPIRPVGADQTWTWSQTRMMGQDRLPNRQQDWPLPIPPPRIDQTSVWSQTRMFGRDRLPNRQQDWPLPIPPPRIDQFTGWRQTDKFGRDNLPNRQQDWPNPTQPPRIDATWVQGFVVQLQPAISPFTQTDWPNPIQPPRLDQTWVWRQTGMQGQDSLPTRQQDWPLPGQPPRLDQTWLQGFSLTLSTTVILYPHNQFDWPNPTIAPRLHQSWTWSQTRMFGQDRLPFRQMDWPLPALHHFPRIEQTIASGFTLELEGSVINFVPHNQTDWQLPIGWQMVIQPDRGSAAWPGINLLPPPLSTFTPEWIIRARRRGRR